MNIFNRISIFAVLFFLFSIVSSAQQIPPSYGFLEVVDYKNEPVAGASVGRLNMYVFDQSSGFEVSFLEKTNEKGLLEKGIRLEGGYYRSPLSIDKSGYYSFIDCFELFKFLRGGWRDNRKTPTKIELLKIPETDAEKKAIGNEQRKRELFLAIYKGDTVSLGKSIKSRIDPNITTDSLRGIPAPKNLSAIVYAADLANIEAIRRLLSAGVRIDVKNSPSYNILINYLNADPFPVRYPKTEQEKSLRLISYENGVEMLIKAGANKSSEDERGNSPLMIASEKGYLQSLKTLLKSGLPVNEQKQKDNALLIAVGRGHFEIAEFLIKNNANPNFPKTTTNSDYGNDCNAPLTVAAERNDLRMAKLLIDSGANVNFICKNGTSAFSKAIERKAHNYYNPEYEKNIEKIIDLLFDSGLDINASDERGTTHLMTSVYYNNYETVERLLKMRAPIDLRNKLGSTALMLAVSSLSKRTYDVVKLLIKSGANVNATTDQDQIGYEGRKYAICESPLINAAINANNSGEPNVLMEAMQLLVESGANVNFRCSSGESALTQAARYTSANGIKKLIELGADVKGEQGTLALKYAKERLKNDPGKRAERVVGMLEAAGAKE